MRIKATWTNFSVGEKERGKIHPKQGVFFLTFTPKGVFFLTFTPKRTHVGPAQEEVYS